jgi:hypothetical protein
MSLMPTGSVFTRFGDLKDQTRSARQYLCPGIGLVAYRRCRRFRPLIPDQPTQRGALANDRIGL